MSDRLQQIRETVEQGGTVFTADIKWLIDDVERRRKMEETFLQLVARSVWWAPAWKSAAKKWRKRALMYERVKS